MCHFIKVTGESLSPVYQAGDFVLVLKIPFLFRYLKQGDVVVFRQPGYGTLIKQIDHCLPETGEFFVVGLQEASVDSRVFGPVSPARIVGKVILHLRKPER